MRYEPIHHSELKAFLGCRFKWWLSAPPPRGRYLESKNPRSHLHIGRLAHSALQQYVDQGIDPDVAFLQLALEEEARLDATGEGMWEEDRQRIREATEMMVGVLRGYKAWAIVHDADTEILATEVVWGEDTPVMYQGIPFAGRFDAVIRRPDGVWVLDYKTTTSTNVRWTEQDMQATLYIWAAQQMFEDVRGMVFRFIRKKAPWDYDKLILKSGAVTQRSDLEDLTTLQHYLTALAVAVLNEIRLSPAGEIWFKDVVVESYADLDAMLRAPGRQKQPWWEMWRGQYMAAKRLYYVQIQWLKGQNQFIWEVPVVRTERQMRSYMQDLIAPAAWRMMEPNPWIAPTGLGQAYALCGRCSTRYVCRSLMDGSDWEAILAEDFRLREKEEFE